MLKIKLARFGKRHQPHFRIVVNEARDKRDGKYIALLGHYAPSSEPKILDIQVADYQAWLVKGAQPTETVANLFTRFQSGNAFPAKKPGLSKKAKAKLAAAKVEAEKPVEEAKPAEAPVVEAAVAATETPAPEATPKAE